MSEDLASMSEKQRAKEFKAVAKGIRSKDVAVKEPAFAKLYANKAYIFEGDCFKPLFETLIPKKGAYEPCLANITAIENLLKSISVPELSELFKGLFTTSEKSFAVLQTLCNLISYKEEVKIPKQKKGEPEFVLPPENEQVVVIRNKAIESFATFLKAIEEDADMRTAVVTTIPNLLNNQLTALNITFNNMQSNKEEAVRKRAIEETKLVLSTMTRSMLFSDGGDYANELIRGKQWIPLLTGFIAEESLYLSCLQVVRQVANTTKTRHGIMSLRDSDFITIMYSMIENIANKMEAFNIPKEAAPVVDAKGKAPPPPKKDDKKGKGAAEAAVAAPIGDPDKDMKNYLVSCAKYCGEIFKFAFGGHCIICPDDETSVNLATSLIKLMKNSSIPEICRANDVKDGIGVITPINDTLNYLCAALGGLSEFDESTRSSICSRIDDAVKVLVELLQNSASIVGFDSSAPQSEAGDKLKTDLSKFRGYLEKTILCLATSHVCSLKIEKAPVDVYWPGTASYVSHLESIEKLLTSFVDMATQTLDLDLSDRALRLVAFFVYTLKNKDKSEIATLFKFDAAFVSKLSVVIQSRSTSTVNGLKLYWNGDLANCGLSVLDETLMSSSPDQTLYYSLLILVAVLDLNPEVINVFCNKDRIILLRDILYLSGPSSVKAFGVKEFQVEMRNPWNYNSDLNPNYEPFNHQPDCTYLRPLIIDVLTKICESDKVYRTYEGELPVQPGKEVIKSSSKTHDSVMTCIKYASDAVVSILLTHVKLICHSSFGTMMLKQDKEYFRSEFSPPQYNYWTPTISQLLTSALKFMISVSRCGSLGSFAMLESVAESAKNKVAIQDNNWTLSPLSWLRDCLLESGQECQANLDAFSFTRSQFFSDFFPTSDPASLASSVVSNLNSWPYITLILSLLSVISEDSVTSSITSLALDAIQTFCQDANFDPCCQPVVCDILSAVLLSFGGVSILSGYLGKFGRLVNDDPEKNSRGVSFLMYIMDRGSSRETFWASLKEASTASAAAAAVQVDPKTGKPAAAAPSKKEEKKKEEKKPPAGKDAKGGGGGGGAPTAAVVEEVKYNIEPEDPNIDPNRGPSKETWLKFIDNFAADTYNIISESSGLISSIHGSLTEVSLYLIDSGVNINYAESNLRNALVFAFIFGESAVAEKLVSVNAELDAVDGSGNPMVKYAYCTLSSATLETLYSHNQNRFAVVPPQFAECAFYGSNSLFSILQQTRVDINAPDSEGNYPVHFALGLCEVKMNIAGNSVSLVHDAYVSNDSVNDWGRVEESMRSLVAMNADINLCNRQGFSPLHFTAVKGDVSLSQYLLSIRAKPNVLDAYGFLPLHYVALCCPDSSKELFDLLFEATINRPIDKAVYGDYRVGRSKVEKIQIDIDSAFASVFGSELDPASKLSYSRASAVDIFALRNEEGLNLLHMCLASDSCASNVSDSKLFKPSSKMDRINLALRIINMAEQEGCLLDLIADARNEKYNFSVLHAASLLLTGVTPQQTLPEKPDKVRKVSRRVTEADRLARQKEIHSRRQFVNEEARLVDVILEYSGDLFESQNFDYYYMKGKASCKLFGNGDDGSWSPLHAAIANDNSALCKTLLERFKAPDNIVKVMMQYPNTSLETVQIVLDAVCSESENLHRFELNSPCISSSSFSSSSAGNSGGGVEWPFNQTFLHYAVDTKNINFIRVACSKVQIDVNLDLFDDNSSVGYKINGASAFSNACFPPSTSRHSDILASEFIGAMDRMDLLGHLVAVAAVADANIGDEGAALVGQRRYSVVERAIQLARIDLLELFIKHRQNDVLHVLLNESNRASGQSLLLDLELKQVELVTQIYGGVRPSTGPVIFCNQNHQLVRGIFNSNSSNLSSYSNWTCSRCNCRGNTEHWICQEDVSCSYDCCDACAVERAPLERANDNTHEMGSESESEKSATQLLLLRELDDSCKVLAVLLPLVNDSNLVSCNAHAHRCFFDNQMYRDV